MMGRSHALSGLTAWAFVAPAVNQVVPIDGGEYVLGAALCAGAAVLPDIDHPNSGVSRTFGPVTRLFAWLVEKISGGHRNGTHSFLGSALFGVIIFGAAGLHSGDPVIPAIGLGVAGLLVVLGIAAGLTDTGKGRGKRAYANTWELGSSLVAIVLLAAGLLLAVVFGGRQAGTVTLFILIALCLAAPIRLLRIKGWIDDLAPLPIAWAILHSGMDLRVVPWAIVLGVLVHITGDMITTGGCPLGWPWSQTNRGPRFFDTNSKAETRVGYLLVAALAAGVALHFGLAYAFLCLPAVVLIQRPKKKGEKKGKRKGGGKSKRGSSGRTRRKLAHSR